MAVIFDGKKEAWEREMRLRQILLDARWSPRMMSIVFEEDAGSQLYTKLKFQAATRVGIEFSRQDYSMSMNVSLIEQQVRSACEQEDLDGVMVQKPTKESWYAATGKSSGFSLWWQTLTAAICTEKDVDCLTKQNLDLVYTGEWKLLPATVRAVISILEIALKKNLLQKRSGLAGKVITVVGRSEIVGAPLAAVLEQMGAKVYVAGSQVSDLGLYTRASNVIISATGQEGLIGADLVAEEAIVIDVGAPRGDVDFEAVKEKVTFITPVPGGVGPMTVVSLLENLVELKL